MDLLRVTTLLCALGAVCAACADRSGPGVRTPGNVAGEYALMTRNGGRLPHVMPTSGGSCRSEIVRDVLTLRADGSTAEELEGRVWCDGPRPDTTFTYRTVGSFTLRGAAGDSITVTPDTRDPGEVMKGQLAGDELRVHDVTPPGVPEVRYRYVRQR